MVNNTISAKHVNNKQQNLKTHHARKQHINCNFLTRCEVTEIMRSYCTIGSPNALSCSYTFQHIHTERLEACLFDAVTCSLRLDLSTRWQCELPIFFPSYAVIYHKQPDKKKMLYDIHCTYIYKYMYTRNFILIICIVLDKYIYIEV